MKTQTMMEISGNLPENDKTAYQNVLFQQIQITPKLEITSRNYIILRIFVNNTTNMI